MENNQEKISRLLAEIEAAEHNGSPVDALCVEAIGCLETARQEFLHGPDSRDTRQTTSRVGEIEIQQLTAMRQLARRADFRTSIPPRSARCVSASSEKELVAANFDE